jgi:hypothetical protein
VPSEIESLKISKNGRKTKVAMQPQSSLSGMEKKRDVQETINVFFQTISPESLYLTDVHSAKLENEIEELQAQAQALHFMTFVPSCCWPSVDDIGCKDCIGNIMDIDHLMCDECLATVTEYTICEDKCYCETCFDNHFDSCKICQAGLISE